MRLVLAQAVPLLAMAVAAYAAVTVFAYLVAERVMFQPPRASYGVEQADLLLRTDAGERIAAAFLENPDADFVILLAHGNAEDVGHLAPLLEAVRDLGFGVVAYDYPGYGASDGRPTAAGAVRGIDAAYRFLVDEAGHDPGRIILYGRSVGSGPVLDLASREPVGGVVLESAFTSEYRVMTRYPILPFDRFPNLRLIRRLDRPLLVIHGTRDGIIPWHHGRALYAAAPGPKRHLWVEGAGHNDLLWVAGEGWADALREFAGLVERER